MKSELGWTFFSMFVMFFFSKYLWVILIALEYQQESDYLQENWWEENYKKKLMET